VTCPEQEGQTGYEKEAKNVSLSSETGVLTGMHQGMKIFDGVELVGWAWGVGHTGLGPVQKIADTVLACGQKNLF
tara:strand:+ start:5262 stop:5486 length:225 start_codon:yes stop_codon:yes gene_type:complete